MKKLIFSSMLILTFCFFSACSHPFSAGTSDGGNTLSSPSRKPEGFVTIYLDGSAPVSASRAVNRTIAMMSADYFEVTFLYNDNGSPISARGDWKIGESAGVSGVYRTVSGVDYGNISLPGNGEGSAILFAGKSDKTLLAVGKLYGVDGAAGTVITSDTKSVTFILYALEAGVADSAANSSFLTAAGDHQYNYQTVNASNTRILPMDIGGKNFPLFRLEHGQIVYSEYNFELHSGEFNDFSGIRIAAAGIVETRQPRYTLPDGNIQTKSTIILDNNTVVTLTNNNTGQFNKTVEFTLNTSTTVNGSIFSFVFSIPVYALTDGSRWFIRPGYAANQYDLDDGTSGMGGAILIGTGYIQVSAEYYGIKVMVPPLTWLYDDKNRSFTVDGIQVDLINNMTGESLNTITSTELIFKIGNAQIVPDFYNFPDEYYGTVPVRVQYQYPPSVGPILEDVFYILVSTGAGASESINFSNISASDIIHIYPAGSAGALSTDQGGTVPDEYFMSKLGSIPNGPLTRIIILHTDLNLRNTVLDTGNNAPYVFFFVAAAPNLTIKRKGGYYGTGNPAQIVRYGTNAKLNAWWFGLWPFNDNVGSSAQVLSGIQTFPYTIDTTTRYDDNGTATGGPQYTIPMIVDGQAQTTSTLYNVRIDPRLTVIGDMLY